MIIVVWVLCFILGMFGNELNKNLLVIFILGIVEEEMVVNMEYRYLSLKCF